MGSLCAESWGAFVQWCGSECGFGHGRPSSALRCSYGAIKHMMVMDGLTRFKWICIELGQDGTSEEEDHVWLEILGFGTDIVGNRKIVADNLTRGGWKWLIRNRNGQNARPTAKPSLTGNRILTASMRNKTIVSTTIQFGSVGGRFFYRRLPEPCFYYYILFKIKMAWGKIWRHVDICIHIAKNHL